MRILFYNIFKPALDQAKASIRSIHPDAFKNILFEDDPEVLSRRLTHLAHAKQPFVLVCCHRFFPRIWGYAEVGDLVDALKAINPDVYVVVLSPNTYGTGRTDESIERGTPQEKELYERLALLSLGRISSLVRHRAPPPSF